MEVFGELKNAYLEKDNAGKTALGAICCGDNITSEFDAALTTTPKVTVGNGTDAVRLATTPELNSVNSIAVDALNRVAAVEQITAKGPGYSAFFAAPEFSPTPEFIGCYEQNTPYYKILRFQSSSTDRAQINLTVKLGDLYGLGYHNDSWGPLTTPVNPLSILVVPHASFKCPPLAWNKDLTQADNIAAPYTEAYIDAVDLNVNTALFYDLPDQAPPRLLFRKAPPFGSIGINLALVGTETSVVFHRNSPHDIEPAFVEFITRGLSYKMLYSKYISDFANNTTTIHVYFRHRYFGARDTYAYIYEGYKYFLIGNTTYVIR